MCDYYTPTVIQPSIPAADITPIERLLLDEIFTAEPDGDAVYFYAEDCPASLIWIDRAELEAAIAVSPGPPGTAATVAAEQLAKADPARDRVIIDVSGTSWEFIFGDIVRRSPTLDHITAVSAFTCSKMRPDGFGGMAVLITADRILGKSTFDLITDFLAEAEIVL